MGSNASKRNETPVVTPKKNLGIVNSSDPRSPTPEITRTPLQGETGCKHNITKNVDLRKSFENGLGDDKSIIRTNPILSAVIKNNLLSFDPRSPTQDFQRTPIILASKLEELANTPKQLKLKKECYDGSPLSNNQDDACNSPEGSRSNAIVASKNLCNEFLDMTLNDTLNESDKPLGESTASNEAIIQNNSVNSENKPAVQDLYKASQVLETNLDELEDTYDNKQNLDNDSRVKYVTEQNKVISVKSDNEFNASGTDLDISNVPIYKILEADPRSPTVGIERTPIIVVKDKNDSSYNNNVEEMSDDSLIKVLQEKNALLREHVHKPDNSEELLIYEDQSATQKDTPKMIKTATSSDRITRTPLSCMKNKGESSQNKSKSVNSLSGTKDNKINKRVSHIPRLKALSKQYTNGSSISLKAITKPIVRNGDCENTPPHSHREKWDKDNSIVL